MRILITLFLSLICASAYTQAFTFTGSIRDSKTEELIPGALIRSTSGKGVATDTDGYFSIEVSGTGDSIFISMIGYADLTYVVRTGDDAVSVPIFIYPVGNELKVVVVSAGKFEQDISEVTVSMEVLKPELLHDKNVVTLDEILQQTPGVSMVNKEPQIRSGSGYSFGAGSRVQILVDDLPVLSGDAGRPSWGFLPVENVSQVEVIKGASSVLYGSAALSGVVNMRTAYPADTARTVITLYHGVYSDPRNTRSVYWNSNGMRTGLNFLHSQKFGQLDLVLTASYYGDDGKLGPIKDTATGKFTDGYNPFTADRYDATNRLRGTMNLRHRSKKHEGLSYGVNTNWNTSNSLATLLWENSDSALYSAYNGSATRTIQLMGTADPYITYYRSNGNKHSLRTRWQSLDNDNDNNQGNFSDQYYAEYQYQVNWENLGIKKMTTTIGAVGIYTDARGQLYTGGNPDGHNIAKNYAGFFQVDKKFMDRLNISAGVRYEYFEINKTSASKPVFRAGANYQLARASYLRASYGQGYRFPSVAEKYIVTGVGAINIFANPDLVPETSYNAELGFKQGFKLGGFYGFIDLAVFQQEYKNFIEFTFGQWQYVTPITSVADIPRFQADITKSIGFKSVNTGRARVRGAECSVMGEGKLRQVKVQLLAGYTYTQPVSLTPDYAYGKPENGANSTVKIPSEFSYNTTSSDTGNNILKYRMQHLIRADIATTWQKLTLGVSFRYNSHVQNIDRAFGDLERTPSANFNPGLGNWRAAHTGGDYVIDARFGYQVNKRHRVSLVVSNLLNREYAIRPLAIEEPRITTIQYVLTL